MRIPGKAEPKEEREKIRWSEVYVHVVQCMHLPRGLSLSERTLKSKLLLLKVLGGGVLILKHSHGIAERSLDTALATLQATGGFKYFLNTGDVTFELLAHLEALAEGLVGGLELVCFLNHLFDVSARQLADSVGDSDVGSAAGRLLSGGDLQDTVDINLEDTLESSLTGAHGGERSKSELAQGGVVGTVGTLTLVDGELNGGLVVDDSSEGALLNSRDGLTTVDNGSEDVTLHGNTEGERDNVQKEKVRGLGRSGLAGENTSLNGSTVGNSLIGVDALLGYYQSTIQKKGGKSLYRSYLLELLAIEEVAQELLDTGDTGRTTNKDDLIDLVLRNARVLNDLLDGLKGSGESLGVKVFETGTGDGGVEVLTVEERVDLNGGLGSVGEGTLSTLTSSAETTESTSIAGEILAGLTLELLLKVVKEVSIEVLTTKVGVTSGSLNGEDTTLDVQQGNIEGTTTEIVDQHVTLLLGLSGTETVGDSGGGRLVNDTEDVEASDGTGILGSLTLVVVEVSRHGDDGLLNLLAKLDLGNLLHLFQESADQSSMGEYTTQFTFMRTIEEISWGEKVLVSFRYSTSTTGWFSPRWTTLKGQDSTSFLTMGSSKRRPIRRLMSSQHRYFGRFI